MRRRSSSYALSIVVRQGERPARVAPVQRTPPHFPQLLTAKLQRRHPHVCCCRIVLEKFIVARQPSGGGHAVTKGMPGVIYCQVESSRLASP